MAPDPVTASWLATVASRIAASLATKTLAAAARGVRKKLATWSKKPEP